MNREERRALERKPKKVNKHDPNNIIQFEKTLKFAKNSVKVKSDKQELKAGDKVKINLEAVKARANYIHMNEKYKKFCEENEDTVFTVKPEHESTVVVTFEEDSTWLFWCGDLIKV